LSLGSLVISSFSTPLAAEVRSAVLGNKCSVTCATALYCWSNETKLFSLPN